MKKYFYRKDNVRKEYKKVYIFTEGTETEPIYFNAKKKEIEETIRRKNIEVKVKGTGYNTKSLVDYVLDFIEDNDINLRLDDCWVVFDKDDFNSNFDNAINKAISKNLKVAYSNESFELWFLLHFNHMNSALTRKMINKKLTKYLKEIKKYKKITNIYPLIKHKEKNAIKNAEKLLKEFENEKSFLKKNPSTTVHKLIISLNKLGMITD